MSRTVLKHYGKVVNGVERDYTPELYKANLAEIESAGGEYVKTIQLKGKKVTLDQYAYFFGAVVKTALEFNIYGGWSKGGFQQYYEQEFLWEPMMFIKKLDDGSEVKKQGFNKVGIEDLNRKEMGEFIDKVIMQLATEGIVVLSPEQYQLQKFASKIINKQ